MGVETVNFEDLRAVRMTDIDGVTKREDIFLPTPEEYLSICKKYEKEAVLELKNNMTSEHVIEIANIVKKAEMFSSTTFISFSKTNLIYLRVAYPDAKAQFLTTKLNDENISFMLENKLDADIHWKALTKDFVNMMHENERVVNCWTVDSLAAAESLRDMGVDMITSNILE